MVKYKRKTNQAAWNESTMRKAISDVTELNHSINSTASKYGIPFATLRRHVKTGSFKKKLGRFTAVFTVAQEQELLDYLFEMVDSFYGFTRGEFLRYVCQYAEDNHIHHPFKNGTAGIEWYRGFVQRHPDLKSRKLEWQGPFGGAARHPPIE